MLGVPAFPPLFQRREGNGKKAPAGLPEDAFPLLYCCGGNKERVVLILMIHHPQKNVWILCE